MDPIADLLRPEAYPYPFPSSVELRETLVSWVFLTNAGDVLKVKKPVRYRFLDFSTVDARRRACEAEVVLNQRLAASAYFGVVPVRRDANGRLHFGPDGEIVDWAVHMLRLPDEARADVRLANESLAGEDVDSIARHVVRFHARALRSERISLWGSAPAVERNLTDNFAEVQYDAIEQDLLTREQLAELESWQLAFVDQERHTFERRCAEGRVCEGHGDLRLDHVYFGEDGGVTVLDCIEFNEALRCGDVCSDIAFLSMDLAAHGRVDLAERFLARYALESGDYGLYRVVDFYESYRAFVRAKVSALLARDATPELRRCALADARLHFALALAGHRRRLLPPVLVAVGGGIATGKSTVADAIADRLASPVVSADRARKGLLGLAPTASGASAPFEGAYDPSFSERVYGEVFWCASHVLRSGRPVVVDASFRTAALRRGARDLAREYGAPFLMIECRSRPETVRSRLSARERSTTVSDARRAVLDAFTAGFEPMTELGYAQRIVVDTSRPLEATIADIERRLNTWPRGLVA